MSADILPGHLDKGHMNQQRILIIGGSGFLGSRLCRILHATGKDVAATVRRRSAESLWVQYQQEEFDALPDNFDLVYLLAAHIPYGEMNNYSPLLIDTNLGLPLRVAERFQCARLIYASSVSVYGTPLWQPITEEHPFNRPSAYALSKLAGEVAVAAHSDQVTLRFSSLYGAGMAAKTFLPLIIEQARQTGRITLSGDGARTQDYLHVQDAARMLMVAGEGKATGIYNAVNGRARSNLEVARTVAALMPGVKIVFGGEDRTPSCTYSTEHWREFFPAIDPIELATGVAEMMTHAK